MSQPSSQKQKSKLETNDCLHFDHVCIIIECYSWNSKPYDFYQQVKNNCTREMHPQFSLAVLMLMLMVSTSSLYNEYYRKCRLHKKPISPNIAPIEEIAVERVAIYPSSFYIEPKVSTQIPLKYTNLTYFYIQFIAAGGSGEVYLVELEDKLQGKILKRFFHQKKLQFMRQNYIFQQLGKEIQWIKDCGENECTSDSKNYNTAAIYEYKESTSLRDHEFSENDAPLIFYKSIKELVKIHKKGIIHNDIKLGNILINSVGPHFKFSQIEYIDWNLASFYYKGYDSNNKKGTVCYYAPELLFRTNHLTPAVDVWSLGVVMFTFFTDRKPFSFKCKTDNLRAIVSLVGGKKIVDLVDKYRYGTFQNVGYINELRTYPQKYPPSNLKSMIPAHRTELFTDQLLQVFQKMFIVDPEQRATPQELLQFQYFKNLKKLPKIYEMKNMKLKSVQQDRIPSDK